MYFSPLVNTVPPFLLKKAAYLISSHSAEIYVMLRLGSTTSPSLLQKYESQWSCWTPYKIPINIWWPIPEIPSGMCRRALRNSLCRIDRKYISRTAQLL